MNCPDCNNVNQQGQSQVIVQQVVPQIEMSQKSRTVYAVLALFFGWIGVHEFYRGKIGQGIGCIFCSAVLSPFLVQLANGIMLFCTKTDSDNKMLQGGAVVPAICGILMILGNLLLALLIVAVFFCA